MHKRQKRNHKKRKTSRNPMYVSPDGGETVYEQLPTGHKNLLDKSEIALDKEQEMYEMELVGTDAIALRRKYPALQKAWNQYKTIWKLVAYKE